MGNELKNNNKIKIKVRLSIRRLNLSDSEDNDEASSDDYQTIIRNQGRRRKKIAYSKIILNCEYYVM